MTNIWTRFNTILLLLILFSLLVVLAMLATGARGGPLDPPGTPGPTDGVRQPGTPINGPVNITVPGHYYLTRNIEVSGAASGVLVSVGDVSIDLGGFTISGNDTLNTYGILVGAVSRVEIRNGHIRDFNFGLDAGAASLVRIDGVSVSSNSRGITLGSYSTLSNCTARFQTETGVLVAGASSTIRECVASNNSAPGITLDGGTNLLESSAIQNNNLAANPNWGDILVNSQRNAVRNNLIGGAVGGAQPVRLNNTLNVVVDNVCRGDWAIFDGVGNNYLVAPDHNNVC